MFRWEETNHHKPLIGLIGAGQMADVCAVPAAAGEAPGGPLGGEVRHATSPFCQGQIPGKTVRSQIFVGANKMRPCGRALSLMR